jgi:hypothetical protein
MLRCEVREYLLSRFRGCFLSSLVNFGLRQRQQFHLTGQPDYAANELKRCARLNGAQHFGAGREVRL